MPEQGVEYCQCTGEVYTVKAFDTRDVTGKLWNVEFTVGNRTFKRKAITQLGETISWTAMFSVDLEDTDDMDFMMKQIRRKKHLGEEERHYMPPRMEQGTFQHAMLVSQGNAVEAEEGPDSVIMVEPELQCEEVKEVVADKESGEKEEERVEGLVSEESSPSVDGEVSDVRVGGNADSDAEVELSIQTISSE